MKKYYSISIPKPCHENWNSMTSKEKGRFCNSCAKTVIDFTKMNNTEIQDFIVENKNKRICGHFKQSQLDSINIQIPAQILKQHQNFHRVFLLALLIAMGTSLMNCTNKHGERQKIDSIEVIDTVIEKTIDTTKTTAHKISNDTIVKKSCSANTILKNNIITSTLGEPIVDSILEKPEVNTIVLPEPVLEGMIDIMGDIEIIDDDHVISCNLMNIDSPPQFKNTPSKLSNQEKKDYFTKQIHNVVSKNFNASFNLDLTGHQRIVSQFIIDEHGNIADIKVRAPHPDLEKEARRVINLLPQFEPAKQRDRPVKMTYDLPIVFQIEE
ncbi:energy transducer TonB [uncultured Algibacter sp.]|uniref:energy transducer TonB n=1 Tax=uncultured Algibacter sp. TaxID=298659 RepID=UPI003217A96E